MVDRLIELASSRLSQFREKEWANSELSIKRYWFHNVIHSVAFKALAGSVLFQMVVLLVIAKTPNPSYWKLFLGIALLLSVAKFRVLRRYLLSVEPRDEVPGRGVMLRGVTIAYELGYERKLIFDRLSVRFAPGINFVWGPNGSGKSTLLGLINGTISSQSGQLIINGEDVTLLPAHKRSTYLLTQNPNRSIAEKLSVYENVIAVNGHSGSVFSLTTPRKAMRLLDDRLSQLGLAKLVDANDRAWVQEAGKLSGGQAQRLALQMTVFSGADVILADEPTSGLDETNVKTLLSIFQKLEIAGKTLIITTHDNRLLNWGGNHHKIAEGYITPLQGKILENHSRLVEFVD